MNLAELNAIANKMVARGRGILAADESTGTIAKRFDKIGVENTEANRRDYREMMFRAKDAMKYVSGVILYDETIWQKSADGNGTPLPKLIEDAGSIPGIKVDEGTAPLPGFAGETITNGLDGLSKRLPKYYDAGARFAKWRAVIEIADGIPTAGAIKANQAIEIEAAGIIIAIGRQSRMLIEHGVGAVVIEAFAIAHALGHLADDPPVGPGFARQRQVACGNGRRLNQRGGRLSESKKFVQQIVEPLQRRHMRLHDETILAGDAMALDHLGRTLRQCSDLSQLTGHWAHADENRNGVAECGRIDIDPVAML